MSKTKILRRSVLAAVAAVAASLVACTGAVAATDPALTNTTPATSEPAREGWSMGAAPAADYPWTSEPDPSSPGRQIRVLRHTAATVSEGFSTLRQAFAADKYRGKRVRFAARVRSENVATFAALWMRVDGEARQLAFDNMQKRPIHGTTAWTTYAIVLDVAPEAIAITLGLLVEGAGAVWLAEPRVEAVGADVATTDGRGGGQPRLPVDFVAEPTGSANDAWFIAGSKPARYAKSIEVDRSRASGRARALRSVAPPRNTEEFGTLMQSFSAAKFRGKRVRFSADVRTREVTESGLWMRVDRRSESVALDNMADRPIRGTTTWARREVVLDVGEDAGAISLDLFVQGEGMALMADPRVEVVGLDVPVTAPIPRRLPSDFAE